MVEWKISDKSVGYKEALSFMDRRVADIHEKGAEDLVWLLEHPPLYTGGTSAKPGDLLNPQFPVYETGRGGEYTYHGPGQRIAYVMMDLKKRGAPDVKKYVCDLEEWIIRSLKEFGIQGERRKGRIGIWVNTLSLDPSPFRERESARCAQGEGEAKIAAIGVRVRHWITLHGISININPDLSHFEGIVPCGVKEYGVTSMSEILGRDIAVTALDKALRDNFFA